MSIVAGEYGFEPADFRRLLTAGAVDVLQADATRCGGITGFLKAAALAEAFAIPLSSHGAPALHRHAACAAPGFTVLEYFHDHARIEELLFEGAGRPAGGMLAPAPGEPGLGLLFRRADAAPYAL
jgi:L-alanine-DL-glutamate epimerase-like enolase superfamily enzyme